MDIKELLEVFNGSALMEAGHQEWGYIEEKWFLALPKSVQLTESSSDDVKHWAHPNIGQSPFTDVKTGIIDKTQFLKANFQLLKNAGLTDDHALLGAMMRMSILEMGTLALNPRERNVLIDEYVYYQPENDDWDKIVLPKLATARDIAAWAKRFAPSIMSHIMFVFCARGHHWTPEFVEIYQRLTANSFIGSPQGWTIPTSEVMYRSLLHCLGVSPLIAATRDLIRGNRLPAAMVIRFKPAPPIAGAAHITTLSAIIKDMHRHALWERLKSWKHSEMNRIDQEVEEIHTDPYAFHVASKVLCGKERRVVSEAAMDAFHSLAPIALGYVRFLGKKHSLFGQKAVTQKYGGTDPLVEMWADAFDKFGLPNVQKLDIETFFMEVMDTPEIRQMRMEKMKLAQQSKNMDLEIELAEKAAQLKEARARASHQF